jgi:hypothetical protein
MLSSTEIRIEELCARIRVLCSGAHTPENEAKLRKLAQELRVAINEHVRTATRTLKAKRSAITEPDTEEK